MFISRKLAVGKRAQAEGDPPGHPPPLAGDHAEKPFSSVAIGQAGGKGTYVSLREVAMDRDQKTIEKTWAPRSQRINKNFIFLQNHGWGAWGPIVGAVGTAGLAWARGSGGPSPSPAGSSGSSAHADGHGGAATRAPSTFSLPTRVCSPGKLCTISWSERIKGSLNEGGVKLC